MFEIGWLHHPAFTTAVAVISWSILGMAFLQCLVYLLQLPAAWRELRRRSQAQDTESAWQLLISDTALPISLIVPAYNEEQVIVESVRSMLALDYPKLEVIVVNDGSRDNTLQTIIGEFEMEPSARTYEMSVPQAPVKGVYTSRLHTNLLLVDKENGSGKADAMNAGINAARTPLFCVVDADCVLESEALLRSVRPFMEEPRTMVAVGGTIRVVNGCVVAGGRVTRIGLPGRFLPLVQTMEYIRAFLMARLALSRWGVLTIVSGAFGIFRRSTAIEVGGFSHGTVGEDLELVVKMHRHLRSAKRPYLMRYVPEPVCWTEAPETLEVLGHQRRRWQRGSLECFFKHRGMLLNPRYGRIGMLGFPLILIVDVLGPIAEVLGYFLIPLFFAMGVLNIDMLLAFTALIFSFGVFLSVSCLILEEMELHRLSHSRDLVRLALVAVLENFGYRQLNNFWRVQGWWQYVRKQQGWGDMKRKGFLKASDESQ